MQDIEVRPVFIVADAIDLETQGERLERPRPVDEERQQRALAPPRGVGMYLASCSCGQRFYTDERWAGLCAACEAMEPGEQNVSAPMTYTYMPRKFGRKLTWLP